MLAEPESDTAIARRKRALRERVVVLDGDPSEQEPHRQAAAEATRKILGWARVVVRDPLTAFVVVGAAFFLLYAALNQDRRTIEASAAVQTALAQEFELLLGRKPSVAERQKLVADYVDDEILFREALEQKMHLTDKQTKQRLIDKLRFMVVGAPAEPVEADLVDFYSEHIQLYQLEPKVTFDHVFFVQPPADSAGILQRLNSGGRITGDDFWMGSHFAAYGQSMLRGMFGQPFLTQVEQAPKGQWVGPLTSSRGTHFVRLQGVSGEVLAPYLDVRQQVRQDWQAERTRTILQTALAGFRKNYDVQIAP